MQVLTVQSVSKLYGTSLIFKNICCEVHAREILLITGSNGAGKSTLLGIMAGLLRPTTGEVNVFVLPEQVAYLGHSTFLYSGLTARENLVFWAGMYGLKIKREHIDAAIAQVRLSQYSEEKAGRFSRGMAQRLNLARIFLIAPQLVFLDEPGTGLDKESQAALHEDILALQKNGATVVWVSHQVEQDSPLADKILFLEHGRATCQVQDGTARKIVC